MSKQNYSTLYYRGPFEVTRRVVKLLNSGRMKYAQYLAAPFCEYIPKGKRKVERLVVGTQPYILVVEGEGPEVPSAFTEEVLVKGATPELDLITRKSKYSSYDPRYVEEFEEVINPLIAAGSVKVVADFREYEVKP